MASVSGVPSKVSAKGPFKGKKGTATTAKSSSRTWSCSVCTLINSTSHLFCIACNTLRENIPDIEIIQDSKDTAGSQQGQRNNRKVLHQLDSLSNCKLQREPNYRTDDGPVNKASLKAINSSSLDSQQNNKHDNEWECKICTLKNKEDAQICSACLRKRTPPKTKGPERSSLSVNRRKSNDPRAPLKQGLKETYDMIVETCIELHASFVDDAFPPGPRSLYTNHKNPTVEDNERQKGGKVQWLRPTEIYCRDGHGSHLCEWSVMRNPSPSDVCQGHLGNCWFIGSLALISERKELLENIIQTKSISKYGVYIVRLNHFGRWTDVIIDDFLPCDQYRQILYANAKYKQLWVPLVEKAMAKLHGSYEALIGGHLSESLTTLTGFPCEKIALDVPDCCDQDFLWAKLVSSLLHGFLIGAASHCKKAEKMSENEKMGIKARHAYSVLKVTDWGVHRLIQLRNPWGKSSWKGKWSPNTYAPPDMKSFMKQNTSEGGIFWMAFEDFLKHYDSVDICRIRDNWQYHSFQGIFLPYADSDAEPCYRIIISQPTELDVTLYQTEKTRMNFKSADTTETASEVALLLMKETGNSVNLVYFTKQEKRQANINLLVDAGEYALIPVSFGHWTNDERAETFPGFEILMYSSKPIECRQIPSPKSILADAMIQVGLKSCETIQRSDQKVSLYHNSEKSQLLGHGSLFIIENRHTDRYVCAEVDLRKSEGITSTRGLKTIDYIPPNSRQIVNIATAKYRYGSYKLGWSWSGYVTSISSKSKPKTQKDFCNMQHIPELTCNYGLHSPRPI